jgi:hypothetical protein
MTARQQGRSKGKIQARTKASAAPDPQAVRLSHALAALARGLPNPWDESDDYFHGFTAALPARGQLDSDGLRQALAIGARYQIVMSPAADKLTELGNAESDWGADIAGGFRQLATVMQATLSDLTLAFARGNGVIRVRVWLFGRAGDGSIVGLHSITTET